MITRRHFKVNRSAPRIGWARIIFITRGTYPADNLPQARGIEGVVTMIKVKVCLRLRFWGNRQQVFL